MPEQSLHMFDTGGATHVGMVRERNEDNFIANPNAGVWAVADGMGGHSRGDLASGIIVETLKTIARPGSAADLLAACEERIIAANARIREIAGETGHDLIGATVAVLLIYDADYACVWAGDSRLYRIHAGEIEQISHDHTEVAEMLAEGLLDETQAKTWPRRNVITRAIGVHADPELEITSGRVSTGDAFVICSDGLTAHVSDRDILDCVTRYNAQRACDALVDLTLKRGAVDNVTVIVVRCRPEDKTAVPFADVANSDRK